MNKSRAKKLHGLIGRVVKLKLGPVFSSQEIIFQILGKSSDRVNFVEVRFLDGDEEMMTELPNGKHVTDDDVYKDEEIYILSDEEALAYLM